MADTDDTQPVDMNAILRDRDRAGTTAALAARLFGITDSDDTDPDDTDDGGDTAA